jgi:outer membrane lipoprotein-sorting protein
MECNKCKNEMYNLFDPDADQKLVADLKEHLLRCSGCSNDYRDMQNVISMLKPKQLPNTPFLLKHGIINHLSKEENKMTNKFSKAIKLNSTVKKVMAIAAVLALLMLIIPFVGKNGVFMNNTAKAANTLIENSIRASRLIKSMVIKLKVRTLAHDNFALVGTEYNMVEHTIWKTFEKPEKWRVDKGERIVVFDGTYQYLWLPKLGSAIKGDKNANFIEDFKVLLNPESILTKEQSNSKEQDSKFKLEDKDGELHMTIISKCRGNFINDYRKNKTLEESDRRREYNFDKTTKLLKGLKIYTIEGTKETLILEIEKIDYDVHIDPSIFVINLPQGVEWKELTDNYCVNETYKNATSKKAAELFFEGMAKKDWESLKEVWSALKMSSDEKATKIESYYGGLTILKIGEPFKSGLFPGEFVPYEIKLSTGEIRKMNLALRKDNPAKIWVIDGGL